MSEPREKLDISDLKDTFLECPVCVEHYNQTDRRPRLLLSCLHAFCTNCLDQLLVKEGCGQITCPLCRHVQKVKGKADTLPPDPVRGKLVEYLEIKNKKHFPCTDCPDGNNAECKCQECSLYLCKDCTYVHKRHRLTNDHAVIPIEEVREQPLKAFTKGHFCTQHPKHHLEFYCLTDECVCCLSCTVLDHQGHKFQKIEEAVKSRQQELESSQQSVITHVKKLKYRRQEEDRVKTNIQQQQIQTKAEVMKQFRKLERMLNDRRESILNDIDQKCNSLLSSCNKNLAAMDQSLAIAESTDSYFTKAKENADAVEMLQMYPSLKRSLGGSALEADPGEGNVDDVKVKFVPTFVSTVEKVLPQMGRVIDTAETSRDDRDAAELVCFVDEVFTMAQRSTNKKELLSKITDDKRKGTGTSKCSKCQTQTQTQKLRRIKCRHNLCPRCFDAVFKPTEVCPVCNRNCKVITGNMPPGIMTTDVVKERIAGYEGFNTIQIKYSFKDGTQTEGHPEPGRQYPGGEFTAFLPNNPEGQKVLSLLKVAWQRRLTFQIQHFFYYMVVFRIPHKTSTSESRGSGSSLHPNEGIYPDPVYLKNVQVELAELGVTEDDLEPTGD